MPLEYTAVYEMFPEAIEGNIVRSWSGRNGMLNLTVTFMLSYEALSLAS
jgi:hypothetical protein